MDQEVRGVVAGEVAVQEVEARGAVAQEVVAQEAVAQKAVVQEAVVQEAVAQEAVAQEAVAREVAAQEAVAQTLTQEMEAQEAIAPEAVALDPIAQETVALEATIQEAAIPEMVALETITQEAVAQETLEEEHPPAMVEMTMVVMGQGVTSEMTVLVSLEQKFIPQLQDLYLTPETGVNGNNDDDTTNASEDPTANFDIGNCDTYSGLWMWDLSLTCDNVNTLDNCECSFAENLRDDGMLSCDDVSKCPTGCGVCMTCMRLLGCTSEQQQQGATTSSASSNIVPYLIAGAVSVILIAGVAYAVSHRKRKEDSSLGERLVDEEAGSEPNVFLAPVDSAAFDASSPPPDGVARVWLAPVNTEHDED